MDHPRPTCLSGPPLLFVVVAEEVLHRDARDDWSKCLHPRLSVVKQDPVLPSLIVDFFPPDPQSDQ